ncbi:uncharacterized protein LOC119703104 [Motacilla alba alba]|uniref:uncharacterized protein LOC119703104 n=1 Tax=Motacilla alba alba TaxID=1094192 RepID=UPI0018D52574|nr:uncharacterized protein LOC119703104 [Motacilla alba alba]
MSSRALVAAVQEASLGSSGCAAGAASAACSVPGEGHGPARGSRAAQQPLVQLVLRAEQQCWACSPEPGCLGVWGTAVRSCGQRLSRNGCAKGRGGWRSACLGWCEFSRLWFERQPGSTSIRAQPCNSTVSHSLAVGPPARIHTQHKRWSCPQILHPHSCWPGGRQEYYTRGLGLQEARNYSIGRVKTASTSVIPASGWGMREALLVGDLGDQQIPLTADAMARLSTANALYPQILSSVEGQPWC